MSGIKEKKNKKHKKDRIKAMHYVKTDLKIIIALSLVVLVFNNISLVISGILIIVLILVAVKTKFDYDDMFIIEQVLVESKVHPYTDSYFTYHKRVKVWDEDEIDDDSATGMLGFSFLMLIAIMLFMLSIGTFLSIEDENKAKETSAEIESSGVFENTIDDSSVNRYIIL